MRGASPDCRAQHGSGARLQTRTPAVRLGVVCWHDSRGVFVRSGGQRCPPDGYLGAQEHLASARCAVGPADANRRGDSVKPRRAPAGRCGVTDAGFTCGSGSSGRLSRFVGRPFNDAASVGADAGVRRASQLLKKEIDGALGMLGVTAPDPLTPSHVMVAPGVFAALEADKQKTPLSIK
jgi:FMN-dependent dehydrogenase